MEAPPSLKKWIHLPPIPPLEGRFSVDKIWTWRHSQFWRILAQFCNVAVDTSADLCFGGVDSRLKTSAKQGDHLGSFFLGSFRIISRLVAKKSSGKFPQEDSRRPTQNFFGASDIATFFVFPAALTLFGLKKRISLHLAVSEKRTMSELNRSKKRMVMLW